jgi:hypothetical protein
VASKVSQVCCREDLDRICAQVISRIFKLLKDRSIGFPVIVENVPRGPKPVGGSDLVPMPRQHWR